MTSIDNVNPAEINKFGSMAERWWDPQGEFKTLHAINPLRLEFIQRYINIDGQRIVDVGCGGGILTEALARQGADAMGIDLSEELIDVADLHGLESGIKVHYEKISAEELSGFRRRGYLSFHFTKLIYRPWDVIISVFNIMIGKQKLKTERVVITMIKRYINRFRPNKI